jgi:hypothetical protein
VVLVCLYHVLSLVKVVFVEALHSKAYNKLNEIPDLPVWSSLTRGVVVPLRNAGRDFGHDRGCGTSVGTGTGHHGVESVPAFDVLRRGG